VVDAKYDILGWNQLATFFIGDLSELPESDRNMIRWMFRRPVVEVPWSDPETVRFTRSTVADLRAAYGRYPYDQGMRDLVTELLALSGEFAEMWAAHDVESRRPLIKRFDHRLAGPLEFECQILHVGETGQRLIVYCAAPGSVTQAAFRRLAAEGAGGRPAGAGRGRASASPFRLVTLPHAASSLAWKAPRSVAGYCQETCTP
jgi:hypothetical protein